jgi:L-threonylcarbamoyladenylate synthase
VITHHQEGFTAPRLAWPTASGEQREVADRAGSLISHGGLVVYPTDTVYGIGTNPSNPLAVQRIFEAKDRPPEKAIIWLIDDLERVQATCEISAPARALARAFWPGALSMVLRVLEPTPESLPTQAVRVPNHPAALAIIAAAGGAVATTSANRSGSPSARNADEADAALGEHVDLIVDAGTSPGGVESTVLDLSVWPPAILRRGPISPTDIEEIIGIRPEERS